MRTAGITKNVIFLSINQDCDHIRSPYITYHISECGRSPHKTCHISECLYDSDHDRNSFYLDYYHDRNPHKNALFFSLY